MELRSGCAALNLSEAGNPRLRLARTSLGFENSPNYARGSGGEEPDFVVARIGPPIFLPFSLGLHPPLTRIESPRSIVVLPLPVSCSGLTLEM
ncbi:hypothetical protein FA13DRAFT_1739468 [Coprinellus micaceus]|uniref:Uncharacterized protein n=1 Tax=Coprinellus micaceus TaxID=71717 RepID=A0A4Y7SS72_COPMI|nr:hypothetical protein FA13DRAFT_1739468 [Coprinellus micaceus]